MARFLNEDELAPSTMAEAAVTHKHPLAGDVSARVVLLCRALIVGRSWNEALRETMTGRSEAVVLAVDQAPTRPGGIGGYAPEVLQTAIHFLIGAHDFTSALDSSLRYAGPPNYSPVLAGAIGGPRRGATQARTALSDSRAVAQDAPTLFTTASALEATSPTDAPG